MHDAVLGQLRALAAAQLRAARARDDRRGDARAGRAPAHRARAPLRRQAAARGRARAARPPTRRSRCGSALWEQYSACLKPLLEGDPELAGVKAKLLQRGLYVGKQLVARARARAPGRRRRRCGRSCTRTTGWPRCSTARSPRCPTTCMPNGVGISCYSTYSHALLLGLADPCAMSVKQIELADRWLAMWARKIFPVRAAARDRRAGDGRRPRRRRTGRAGRAATPADPAAVDALRLSRQARHQRPRPAEAAAARRESGGAATRPRLQRRAVHRRLLGAPRLRAGTSCRARERRQPPQPTSQLCAGGLAAAYFRVGGRTFDRQDPLGRVYVPEARSTCRRSAR